MKYNGKFKIKTLAGRTIEYTYSMEQSEYIQAQGRKRIIQVWDNRKQEYVTIRY